MEQKYYNRILNIHLAQTNELEKNHQSKYKIKNNHIVETMKLNTTVNVQRALPRDNRSPSPAQQRC